MIPISDIRRYSLFGGIVERELAFVTALLKTERFADGAHVIEEGGHGGKVFFLAEGLVQVVKRTREGEPAVIATLHPGDTFGEMELLDVQPRVATIVAQGPVTCYTFTNQDLLAIRRKNSDAFTMIVMNLARDVSRRLRAMDEKAAHDTEVIRKHRLHA